MTSIHLAERPASAGMDASRAAEAGLSTPSARPLFNELLNLYHGGDELHGPAFCMDNHLPIVVYDVLTPGNTRCVLEGKRIGTLVR